MARFRECRSTVTICVFCVVTRILCATRLPERREYTGELGSTPSRRSAEQKPVDTLSVPRAHASQKHSLQGLPQGKEAQQEGDDVFVVEF